MITDNITIRSVKSNLENMISDIIRKNRFELTTIIKNKNKNIEKFLQAC